MLIFLIIFKMCILPRREALFSRLRGLMRCHSEPPFQAVGANSEYEVFFNDDKIVKNTLDEVELIFSSIFDNVHFTSARASILELLGLSEAVKKASESFTKSPSRCPGWARCHMGRL